MDASSAPAGRAETDTRGSSQGGAVDAFSVPAGKAECETRGWSQGGAVDASSASAGRADSEMRSSSQGGTVDASSVQKRRAEGDLSATSTSDTDQGNDEDPPAVVLDGIRSSFPLVVLNCIFMFESNNLVNPKTLVCFFWCGQDLKGTGWTEIYCYGWRSKGT